jgi:EmrB/QacA subfamily drug resistance transporter
MSSGDDNSTGSGSDAVPVVERQHYGITFAVLALAGISFALLQSAVAPALPVIQHELHTSTTTVAWVLTAYLLSATVLTPIIGRLGDMFGKERTLVLSLVALSAGTLLAAVSNSIGLLIIARVIQGGGGAVFPLAFGIIRDEFPRERVAQGIAMISALLGIGGGLGIVLAGPIITAFNFHWLFWFPLVVVVLATVAAIRYIPESPIKVPGRVNWKGAALLSAWLVCLLVGISQAATWGWGDARVLGLIAAAVVLVVVWVRAESGSREPMVDMRMMRIRGVWTVNAAAFLIGAGMFSAFVLVPQFTETARSAGYGFGASVTQAGLFLLPLTALMLIVSPLAGRLAARVGSRVPLVAGSLASTLALVLMAVAHQHRGEIYLATAILGIGIGLAFASLANLIVEAVPREQTGIATGMNTVMRTLGGAVGAEIGATVIAGTVTLGRLPTEAGFTLAFLIAAGACLLAIAASLIVPRRGSFAPQLVPSMAGTGGP